MFSSLFLSQQAVDLVQIPDLVVDAVTLRRFDSLGIVPAGHDARVVAAADIARERIADDHRLALLDRPDGSEDW